MSTGLDTIRERLADYLNGQGVPALIAWPAGERLEQKLPVAVVSLLGCQAGPGGFQDYLGERYNETTGLWEELYGRRAELTFGLDLYAAPDGGGAQLQEAFDKLAAVLTLGVPEGLALQSFSCGQTEYDQQARLLKRQVEAVCTAHLCAVAQAGGEFLDFELRGGLKQ